MIEQLIALQAKVYANAAAKGFWEKGAEENRGERVMLIVSELGEALESHRKNRWAKNGATYVGMKNPAWEGYFKEYIKDTVEDELADVAIRILDYTGGFNVSLVDRDYRKESTGNFGHDLLRIVHYCICAYYEEPGKDWGYALAALIKFCEWWDIPLLQHVNWKFHYNTTREYKHGKKY